VSGKNYMIQCPDPMHIDKHPSCYFHMDTLVYHCFGCGSKGTIIDLIAYNKDLSIEKSEDYLRRKAGISTKSVSTSVRQRYEKYKLQRCIISTEYRRDWENARDEIQEFVRKKNYNLGIFDKHYVGYNNHIGSITFPIVYIDRVINVGERYVLGDQNTKIKYRKGVPLSISVWGMFDDYNRTNPYFTEGIADALRMREAGLNAYAMLSIVLPNNKMRFILEHFDGVFTIVPDPDRGGDKMVQNWRKVEHYTRVMVMRPEHDDIDATPIDEIRKLDIRKKHINDSILKDFEIADEICEVVR